MSQLVSEQDSKSNAESPEGADEPGGFGSYPVDTLLIRTDQRTVHDILRREQQGMFILDPDYQRAFVWEAGRQSRLIESILMRIPLPVFYLAENDDGKLVVVDGLQRISTLKRFVANEQPLVLDNPDLSGKRFSDLPVKLRNRVEDAQLTLYIIDSKVPERVRLDIFERVNSGRPLTRQQMRNALYQGPATRFLRDAADLESFDLATGGSFNSKDMRDREAINRFCAFYLLGPDAYPEDMDTFLGRALEQMNGPSVESLAEVRASLDRSMKLNVLVFGQHAFRKHKVDTQRRAIINLSLFDVFSVAFARAEPRRAEERAGLLRQGFYTLMEDPDFQRDVTYGTSAKARVRGRFAHVQRMIDEVLA